MNPWPGEGSKMAAYSWVVNDGVHSWTHTQKMITNPPMSTGIYQSTTDDGEISVYPNPTSEKITINTKYEIISSQLFDVAGKEILSSKNSKEINLKENGISKGIYFLKISGTDFSVNKKVVVE